MAEPFEEHVLEMQVLTSEYVRELSKIWSHLFTPDICVANLNKLKSHAKDFYKGLVEESLERQQVIQKEIDDLKQESLTLRRILRVDIELPKLDENIPLALVQTRLDESLEEIRACLKKRQDEIYELLMEQEELCEELGEMPKELLADPLPSAEELNDFRFYLEELKELKMQRIDQMNSMRRDIKDFMKILETKARYEEDRLLNSRDIKLDEKTFRALKLMYTRYESEVKDLREKIDLIREKLSVLWDRTNTSPSSRKRIEKHVEYNLTTYDVYAQELDRMEEFRRQNIKFMVEKVRNEIRVWWERTLKSEAEKDRFINMQSTCYTDDLLDLHEMELEELKNFYHGNKKIFDLYDERKTLWDRMIALEAKANEPGRFKNRGGQLLKEEKERKTIATKLPKIENQISDLVKEYQAAEGKPFLVHGKNILDVLIEDWEHKRQEKEQICSARKNTVPLTPNNKKNVSQVIKKTPLSLQNVTAAARKTPMTGGNSKVYYPLSTSKKRKMATTSRNSPAAKRSLIQALISPRVQRSATTTTFKTPSTATVFKSASKQRPKVIGTLTKRFSSSQKRKSLGKKSTTATAVPKLHIEEATDDENFQTIECQPYEIFEKHIDEHSRSSTFAIALKQKMKPKKGAGGGGAAKENESWLEDQPEPTLLNIPDPRLYTPSRINTSYVKPQASLSTSRKKCAKNLPIIL